MKVISSLEHSLYSFQESKLAFCDMVRTSESLEEVRMYKYSNKRFRRVFCRNCVCCLVCLTFASDDYVSVSLYSFLVLLPS